jgi:hypothetical protein
MGSTPVTGSNLKALRDAPLSFLDFLYKSALRLLQVIDGESTSKLQLRFLAPRGKV